MKTVAIVHGFGGGPRVTKKLRDELASSGYRVVKSPKDADYIIAHSMGCYLVPTKINAQKVMLFGMPRWPLRPFWLATVIKYRQGARSSYDLSWMWYGLYAARRPIYTLRGGLRYARKRIPTFAQDTQVVLVRPAEDTFLHRETARRVAEANNWTLVEPEGYHDDLYFYPEKYLGLL